jgi:CHAD domain-containing protein
MAFRFDRRETLAEGARRLAAGELSAAAELLRDPAQDPALRVHGARKGVKRVRALIRLVRRGLPRDRFRAANLALRDAARRLSAARDAAVALATFDALVPAGDWPDLRAVLAAAADLAAAPDARDAADLAAAADALTAARDELLVDLAGLDPTAGWDVLEPGLRDSYAGGLAAMQLAFLAPGDDAFHEWRKRIKDLWYQVQLLRGLCEPQMEALERLLAELGDRLGEDHDLAVLAAAVAAHPGLEARIAGRRQELRARARELGVQVHAESPKALLRRLNVYWQVWLAVPG